VKTGPDSSFAESVWYVVGVLVISPAGPAFRQPLRISMVSTSSKQIFFFMILPPHVIYQDYTSQVLKLQRVRITN
jgi:hypothetical protein